jgi:hypothetical protein
MFTSAAVRQALETSQGVLRLAPNWVPRSFLMPGRRIKLAPQDTYAYGAHRGGIDERWFSSTTPCANENRVPDEGLSYVVVENKKAFTLADAVQLEGPRIIGQSMWDKYKRWPVYSKYFDNLGPIPHHMHQNDEQAALVGQQGKPESYYFPPQLNNVGNLFPYTFMGLEPGTTKEDIVHCLDRWNEGDNGILNYSKAYRLQPGTGWLIPPCVLHAPGSLVTYEPQWGSDVFGMYQSLVEGRTVPRSLLTKDFPKERHNDNRYMVDALDWNANVNPNFKDSHYLEPFVCEQGDGYVDRWVVYGKLNGKELFSAKELTVEPGASAVINEPGASGLNTTQGTGTINGQPLQTPAMIRFGELTTDEYFITADAAAAGVKVVNTGCEPLVILRYFGPDVHGAKLPAVAAHRR